MYEFGQFAINVEQRSFARDGQRVSLKPKTFDVLTVLVRHMNRAVSKNEIIRAVWHDSFVEEGNLAVHISTLRKIFSANGERGIYIETVPKMGYRLVDGYSSQPIEQIDDTERPEPTFNTDQKPVTVNKWRTLPIYIALGILVAVASIFLSRQSGMGEGRNTNWESAFTWNRTECLRESPATNLEVGGCDDAVRSFSLNSNPNGNWSYGYTPKDDTTQFTPFDKANHNGHFASPEVPADYWTRANEWHPEVLKNTSNMVIVIAGGVIVPPSMLELHPGPNGERSVVRWTAPADGRYRIQGQFRGMNVAWLTSTDVLIVENGSPTRWATDIEGFNIEKPFDLTFKLLAGDTVDVSIGYGKNNKYEGDSTGFSAIVTTLSLESGTNADRQ